MTSKETPRGTGDRKRDGKLRHDLLKPFSTSSLAAVMSSGAKKYADRNWEKGMDWVAGVIGSLKRHLNDFENGIDIDPEDGKLMAAKIAWNAQALVDFYMLFPEGDRRVQSWANRPKIGLDVDEVLAGFCVAFSEWKHKSGNQYPAEPSSWNYGWHLYEDLMALRDNREFWMSIKPIINPDELPFEPNVYVTSRLCSNEFTEDWLAMHGFPQTKVITVGHNQSKLDVVKRQNVNWFVDDKFETFVELNNAGQFCFLFDRKHNRRYDVGHRRLKDLRKIFSPERLGDHVLDDWYIGVEKLPKLDSMEQYDAIAQAEAEFRASMHITPIDAKSDQLTAKAVADMLGRANDEANLMRPANKRTSNGQ